jgi:uncharacterized delta-60 repeat protein
MNGALDTSFNRTGPYGGGQSVIPTPSNWISAEATSIVLQRDQKILVGGYYSTATAADTVLARFNTDGTADTTFGSGGVVISDFGKEELLNDVKVDSTGRIIAAGFQLDSLSHADAKFAIARYASNGTLDTSFGNHGLATPDFDPALSERATSLVIVDDARYVLAGYTQGQGPYDFDFLVGAVDASGAPVQGFGVTGVGYTRVHFGGAWAQGVPSGLIRDSKGDFVISGYATGLPGQDFALARLLPNGQYDSSFGTLTPAPSSS